MSELPPPPAAIAALQQGQAAAQSGDFANALSQYEAALNALSAAGNTSPHHQAVIWMNCGMIHRTRRAESDHTAAIAAFSRVVELLSPIPAAQLSTDGRATLGAGWLNQGIALLTLPEPKFEQADTALLQAIRTLEPLEKEPNPALRANLATARLQLATLRAQNEQLPTDPSPDALVRATLAQLEPFSDMDRAAAGLQVDALMVFCQLHGNTRQMADEVTDKVDEGLALAQRWAGKQCPEFKNRGGHLTALGVRIYTLYQPHFAAEFLDEAMSQVLPPEFWPTHAELAPAVLDPLKQAWRTIQNFRSKATEAEVRDQASQRLATVEQAIKEWSSYATPAEPA